LCGLHGFYDQRRCRFRKCSENATGVKPADTVAENRWPVKVAWLEHSPSFIASAVKHNRRPGSHATIAVNCGNVGPSNAVVIKPLIEWRHAGLADARLYQLADAIAHHRRGDAGLQPKTI